MSELIEALANFGNQRKKRYYAVVKNEVIKEIGIGDKVDSLAISLTQYKMLIDCEKENFYYNDGNFHRLEKKISTVIEPTLERNKPHGYKLHNNNPFWPEDYRENQDDLYIWQIK